MTSATDFRDAGAVRDLMTEAASRLLDDPRREGSSVRLPGEGHLLVTGDLHDNPIHLRKILHLARLERGADRHVVLQELIHGERLLNGLDFSHRMLARVARLVLDHPGQVHPLLANHELAQMTGTAVSKGAGNSVELFDDALDYAFGDAAEDVAEAMRTFVRAMPLAVRSASGLLCAHSLPDARRMDDFDLGVLDRPLEDADLRGPAGSAYLMVWGRRQTPEQVERLAEAWGVRLFCLGHQHVETGIDARARRVLVLNSDHEGGAVLPVDLAALPSEEQAVLTAIRLRALDDPGDRDRT